jgi:hypothetical protein
MVVFMVFLVIVLLQFAGNGGDGDGKQGGRSHSGRRDDRKERDSASKAEEDLRKGETALEEAREFRKANPELYGTAIKKYQDVIRDFGQSWAEICLREIDEIMVARRKKARNEFDVVSQDVETAVLQGRFRDAREKVNGFLKERKEVFGPTKAYSAATKLAADLRVRIDRAVVRFEQDVHRLMANGDFAGARAKADAILLIDPEANGTLVRKLLRAIAEAERKALEAEEDRLGRERIKTARRSTATLVKAWKFSEAMEPFEEIRARSKSRAVWDLASMEIDDLGRVEKLVKALSEAPRAVGKKMTIRGETGTVQEVSGGYIRLKIGRVVRGFRLRDLTADEFSEFAGCGLDSTDREMKRAFAVYLLFMGKAGKAGEIFSTLDLKPEERAFYGAKMGR